MPHVHFAWELGGGLGHAGHVTPVAAEMQRRGWQVSTSLCDLAQTEPLLRTLDAPRFQAPVWLHRTVGGPPTAVNHAELLMTVGYVNPQALGALVDSWRALLAPLAPDLVVGDYAPTAHLAARVEGIRFMALGQGFTIPAADQPLPWLRDWEPVQAGRLEATEAHVLRLCNDVLAARGAAPLSCLADLLRGEAAILCTWPELDPFGREAAAEPLGWFGPLSVDGAGAAPEWPAGPGPRVFAYLKDAHPAHADLLRALAGSGARTLCYVPEVASGKSPRHPHPSLGFARGPVDLRAALAEARLCICHGGVGTLAPALRAGVPLLMLPMHNEQYLASRRIARQGAGVNLADCRAPVDLPRLLRGLLADDGPCRQAAGRLAAAIGERRGPAGVAAICDAIEARAG